MRRIRTTVLLVGCCFSSTALQARAQPPTAYCYVPATGNLYVAGTPDSPPACRTGHGELRLVALPLHLAVDESGAVANLTNTGAGPVMVLAVDNAGHSGQALAVDTNGSGNGILVTHRGSTGSAIVGTVAASSGPGMALVQSGTGNGLSITVDNPTALNQALGITTGSQGNGVYVHHTGSAGSAIAALVEQSAGDGINITHTGTGNGAAFRVDNPGVVNQAVAVGTNSRGNGVFVVHSGAEGSAVRALADAGAGAFWGASSGSPTAYFENTATGSTVSHALYARSQGGFPTAVFENLSGSAAMHALGDARIEGTLLVDALQVLGAKNAVVETSAGLTEMYSEESTEVWFSDHGFGETRNGRTFIPIEPGYAETVRLSEPYHVFLQAMGDAALFVVRRSKEGFEVRTRDGAKRVAFSYRIMAKRRDFEDRRMHVTGRR